jgi:hypothetical protein
MADPRGLTADPRGLTADSSHAVGWPVPSAAMVAPVFPHTRLERGMYESFYLRAVSPQEPAGAWIRYTVHKRPGAAPQGSVWCTVFDASRGAPFMHKHTTAELTAPAGGWIQIGPGSRLGPGACEGSCGPARWSLRFAAEEQQLRHLSPRCLYRLPLPRTKLTSPAPAARFDGTIELSGRTLELRGWRGMVGHNWGSEHAERWIWVHGIGFEQDPTAWIDLALGRVLVAGRMTPWLASGAISLGGQRLRLGGLAARGVSVAESPERCSMSVPGRDGVRMEAHLDVPPGSSAGWRYADPDGGEHDVANCSIASLSLSVRRPKVAGTTLRTTHGGAYELGMRERDHGVPLAPFPDG